MRLIIAGGRDVIDYAVVREAVEEALSEWGFRPSDVKVVLSGKQRGVDALGERWAEEHGIPVDPYPAEWKKYGHGAGPRRNRRMAEFGDALVAVPSGGPGTRSMIRAARSKGLRVYVHPVWP